MDQTIVDRNIKFYKLFKILSMPLFWGPVLISYIVNIGKMSLADVYLMESFVVVGMVFMEIYSSGWADLLGRKKSIIIGTTLELIALVLFVFVSSPFLVIVANIVITIGAAIGC
jgi:MFS family permease